MSQTVVPILAIVGPTATGKSDLAYQVASAWLKAGTVAGVTLISVDSRQVYLGLETISGVDLPPAPLVLEGVSLVRPDRDWSVAHFCQLARPLLAAAAQSRHGVILVGGTGLYHQHLFSQDTALLTPPNQELRATWAEAELEDLQRAVRERSPERWAVMNDSDRANPRRLIRALEKVESPMVEVGLPPLPAYRLVTVGLSIDPTVLAERIARRVKNRLEGGAKTEVERLMADYPDWSKPAFTTTGVREVRALLEGQLDENQCLELWTRREVQYAKRQLTWWKKQQPDMRLEWGDQDGVAKVLARLS